MGIKNVIDVEKLETTERKITLSIREKVSSWHINNQDIYRKFRRNFDRMSPTNHKFAERLVRVVSENVPKEIEELWKSFISRDPEKLCHLLESYGELLEECINEKKTFCVNIASGIVKQFDEGENVHLELGDVPFSVTIYESFYDKMPRKVKSLFVADENADESLEETKLIAFCIMSIILIAIPNFIQNLIATRQKNYNLSYSLCYFLIFDHGLMLMQKKLTSMMTAQNWPMQYQVMVEIMTKSMIGTSVSVGYDTKADWTEQSKHEDEETADVINSALSKVKGRGGRRTKFGSVEELCVGDSKRMIALIIQFLDEEKETVSLAYLFYAMVHTGGIATRDYKAFHRAMKESFPDRNIKGVDKPQARYSELESASEVAFNEKEAMQFAEYRTVKWRRARRIVNKWLPLFEQARNS